MSPVDKQLFIASGNLVSISEAPRNTPYSAEYLSLLARKGRLKAVKISRDWLTTKEAVLDYVKKQAEKHQERISILNKIKTGLKRSGGFGFAQSVSRAGILRSTQAMAHHMQGGSFIKQGRQALNSGEGRKV